MNQNGIYSNKFKENKNKVKLLKSFTESATQNDLHLSFLEANGIFRETH